MKNKVLIQLSLLILIGGWALGSLASFEHSITPEPAWAQEAFTLTPKAGNGIWAEAKNAETNVRSAPDITAWRVQRIHPGTQYRVLGKRFEWILIDIPELGFYVWAHQSVVNINVPIEYIRQLDDTYENFLSYDWVYESIQEIFTKINVNLS